MMYAQRQRKAKRKRKSVARIEQFKRGWWRSARRFCVIMGMGLPNRRAYLAECVRLGITPP